MRSPSTPGLAVKDHPSYPPLLFFKGNDKANTVKYESGCEVKDFIAYLKEHSHNAFSDAIAHDEL